MPIVKPQGGRAGGLLYARTRRCMNPDMTGTAVNTERTLNSDLSQKDINIIS